jgi:hypothetical protein
MAFLILLAVLSPKIAATLWLIYRPVEIQKDSTD